MNISYVIFERLWVLKLFLTNVALIILFIAVLIFLSSMNMQVIFKAFQLGKAFITCFALVLFLSCMNSQVMQQIIGLGETFSANFTLIWLVSCVNAHMTF